MRRLILCITMVLVCSAAPVFANPAIMVEGSENNHTRDLDGSGVIISVADTGIDLDHSCFRDSLNETGAPGHQHRKVIHLNSTIDDWDNQGQQQFRHGTHIAGILACNPLEGDMSMKSLSSGSKLVVQDIVGQSGWSPPEDVSELLSEAAGHGAVINSWSWGDNSINYTNRSKTIDEYTSENPWSLVFVAPGNNGGMMLEPANAYNVVSVAASDSEENGSLWQSSAHGPDVNGRRGTLISAPGIGIVSAKADGSKTSMNNESYAMTGTSMSTPMAASFTALLQQMVQDEHNFTPSAPLLRALLASSAEPLVNNSPDQYQGYGRPALSSFDNPYFVHDSYAIENWTSIIEQRGNSLTDLKNNPWNGSGAAGPFLPENNSWSKYFKPIKDSDVEIVLSYNARSIDYDIDDLRLIVRTSDGRVAIDDEFSNSGYSQLYYESWKDPYQTNSSNETTVMVRLPKEQVSELEWLEIEVYAKDIYQGQNQGMLGLEGDRLGFGLVATGVEGLEQNAAPSILEVMGPQLNENYSSEFGIILNISDDNNDTIAVAVRLVNSNFSVDLSDCGKIIFTLGVIDCKVDIAGDLIPRPVNREDWYFEVIAADNNSSLWTSPKVSYYVSNTFSIWWESPLIEDDSTINQTTQSKPDRQNRAFILAIFGVVIGVIVAASTMFRRFEKRILEGVEDPFVAEEE